MTQEKAVIIQGSTTATFVAFLQASILRMVPYAVPGLMLVVLDLIFGIRAAKARGERVRISTALRRTLTKTFSYLCFIILASTLAIAFEKEWIEVVVLGMVYANEFASIIGNYLETKGLHLSMIALYRLIFKKAGQHAGVEISDEEAQEILKPKPRDARGRFVSALEKNDLIKANE